MISILGKCIDEKFVCDNFDNCGDSSDEHDCTDEKPCNFGACSQSCQIKVHTANNHTSTSTTSVTAVKALASTLINTKRIVSEAACSCIQGNLLKGIDNKTFMPYPSIGPK